MEILFPKHGFPVMWNLGFQVGEAGSFTSAVASDGLEGLPAYQVRFSAGSLPKASWREGSPALLLRQPPPEPSSEEGLESRGTKVKCTLSLGDILVILLLEFFKISLKPLERKKLLEMNIKLVLKSE